MITDFSDTLSIGMVAAQLGVSAATLRKWEERYGMPQPLRLPSGTRRYPKTMLRQLQQAVRLIDGGIPAGKALRVAEHVVAPGALPANAAHSIVIDAAYADLRRDDLAACERRLRRSVRDHGVTSFADGLLAPLLRRLGDGWLSGDIEIYHEHAVTEMITALLREAASTKGSRRSDGDPVLLTTPPEERHTLGLAMVESALAAAGARCINLGPELPCDQVVLAADRLGAVVAGIGISSAVRPRLMQQYLRRLRTLMPLRVQIWIGGEGASRLEVLPDGVRYFDNVADAVSSYKSLIPADKAVMTGIR